MSKPVTAVAVRGERLALRLDSAPHPFGPRQIERLDL